MKAFPIQFKHPTTGLNVENQGMELRDWFAGMALTKLIGTAPINLTVEAAYRWADAMMEQRGVNNE